MLYSCSTKQCYCNSILISQDMAFTKIVQLCLILALSAVCCSRELVVSPECTDLSVDTCITLAQYVQNGVNNSHSSTMLLLDPGVHYLTMDFVLENTINFSIQAGDTSSHSTINCGQNAVLKFENVSNLVIKNITFISCGRSSPQNTPGITMSGIANLKLINITLSESITGALYVINSKNLFIHDLSVISNPTTTGSIVQFEKSNVNLTGTTIISRNTIGGAMLECGKSIEGVIFKIEQCSVDVENLNVSDSIGPNGVMNVSRTDLSALSGNWVFNSNRICSGGSLSLESVVADHTGRLSFSNNSVSNSGVAGILIIDSNYRIAGDIEFTGNNGEFTALRSVNSSISINGSLNIARNVNGDHAVLLSQQSALTITGSLKMVNNSMNFYTVKAETESTITVEGETFCVGNMRSTSLVITNGNISLSGQVTFIGNVGVLFAQHSHVNITGISKFINNSLVDDFSDGALALENSWLALSGNYLFQNNQANDKRGGAIFATSHCTITLSGNGNFTENSGMFGGAIYLNLRTHINIAQGTNLVFLRNKAIKGGAIFVSTSFLRVNCSSPPCLFLPDNEDIATNTSLTFLGNMGDPGGSVLHVNIDRLNYEIEEQTFPALENLHKIITIPDDSNTEPEFFSDSYQLCFCTQKNQNCESRRRKNIMAVRGKPFSILVRALTFYGDYYDEPIRSILESALNSRGNVSFITAKLDKSFQVANNKRCSELAFKVNSSNDQETIILNIGESFLDTDKTLYVDVLFEESCPLGFTRSADKSTCTCNPRIVDHLNKCDLSDETFQKKLASDDFWMGPYHNTSLLLIYDSCPRGYCVTTEEFSFSNNTICRKNREGNLCGQCKKNFSLLLGGVQCDDCSDKNSHLALLLLHLHF